VERILLVVSRSGKCERETPKQFLTNDMQTRLVSHITSVSAALRLREFVVKSIARWNTRGLAAIPAQWVSG